MHDENAVVDLVNNLLISGIKNKASDIHIEPMRDILRVRFRVDGVLHDRKPIAKNVAEQLIGRLKVLSHMNVTYKRVPQDGKFCFSMNEKIIDMRVSTLPGVHGEKVVVRILDQENQIVTLNQLGLTDDMYMQLETLIQKSSGFFLVVGPTGSGKTTTLYAILNQLLTEEKNITTLEDPVEYSLAGITQAQISPNGGFTFANGVRSVLRQDPDIIMVGEIRDRETACVAIEAALTGHCVLSTLHTHDAPSAVIRLMDMGIEPFLIHTTVTGILAQRLVRKICSECKTSRMPDKQEQLLLQKMGADDTETMYEGSGCDACSQTGYKGRTGIFELLSMTPAMRACIVNNPDFDTICAQAEQDGLITLRQDGIKKVEGGITTLSELVRAVL